MMGPRQSTRVLALLLLCGGSTLLLGGAATQAARQSSCIVALTAGSVQGQDLGASCAFLGIPFAATTAGANRWRPPQHPAPWAPALLMATTPPPGCPSMSVVGPTQMLSGNENCLMLNVWVTDPPPSSPAPVIVWLHTGAFLAASANFAGTNGRRLAEETGAIVVAPNYRLGPFGFLSHSALAAESSDGTSGNYGLLDQQAALRWVRDNIAEFGGDPQNVTLAGSSAGGQSVGMHLVMPLSEALFHRAVIQSAYPTSRWRRAAEGAAQGVAFANALGCTDPAQVAACLRNQSRDRVLTALPQGTQQVVEPPGATFWEPLVDGVVIPDQPRRLFESGAFHQVPTLIGFTRDEGWGAFITRSFQTGVSLAQYDGWVLSEFGPDGASVLDAYPAAAFATPVEAMARLVGDAQFVCEGRRLARLVERTGTPIYLYSYEHEISVPAPGFVIHGVESNILFGNNYTAPVFPPYTLGSAEQTLHAAMAGYWTRFAANGQPNSDDDAVVHWPAFKHPEGEGRGADKYMILDTLIREGMRPREQACDFLEPLYLRSLLGGVPASTP